MSRRRRAPKGEAEKYLEACKVVIDEHSNITASYFKGLMSTRKKMDELDATDQQRLFETILKQLLKAVEELDKTFTEAANMAEYVWRRCVQDDVGFKISESPPGLGELVEGQDQWKPRGTSDAVDRMNKALMELAAIAKENVDPKKLELLSQSAAQADTYAGTLLANREIVLKNRLRIDTKEHVPDEGYEEWSFFSAVATKLQEEMHLWNDRVHFAKLLRAQYTKRKLDFEQKPKNKRPALTDRSNKKSTDRSNEKSTRKINGAAESKTKRAAQQNKSTKAAETHENKPTGHPKSVGFAENEVAENEVALILDSLKCRSEAEAGATPSNEPFQGRIKVTPNVEDATPNNEDAAGATPSNEPFQRRSKVTPNVEDAAGVISNEVSQQGSKVMASSVFSKRAPTKAVTKKVRSDVAKYKTLKELPHGSYYFKCPAKLCNKVTLWSWKNDDKQLANNQGMVLLEEDPVFHCRQIDHSLPQLIPCVNFYGFSSMRSHIKKCPLWQMEIDQNDPESPETPPLYRDRRIKIKEDGSHQLTRKEKKDRLNQKAKQKREASERLVGVIVSNWECFGPLLAEKGLTKEMIPHRGEGFMFPVD